MNEKPCLTCSHFEYSANKWKGRYEKLNWLIYNVKAHLIESRQIGKQNIALESQLESERNKVRELEEALEWFFNEQICKGPSFFMIQVASELPFEIREHGDWNRRVLGRGKTAYEAIRSAMSKSTDNAPPSI